MSNNKKRRLSLKDLQLEVKTEEKVVGGILPTVDPYPTPLPTPLPDIPTWPEWAMGPRSDSGAGDASAWNEGDITLAEQA